MTSATFRYTAKDGTGAVTVGEVTADSLKKAAEKLYAGGLYPVTLKEFRSGAVGREGKCRVKTGELVTFTRQLSDMLGAGAPLSPALATIARQTKSDYFKGIILDIAQAVDEGKSLSTALGSYPRIFSELYIGLVQTGETCGMLKELLDSISESLEKEQETRSKIVSAVAYPLIAAGVGVVTLIFLFIFVIPRLVRIFDELHQVLPLPTRIVIGISQFLAHYWPILLGLFAAVLLLSKKALGDRQAFKRILDKAALRLPLWGGLVVKAEIARICRTLGMCTKNGVPILTALRVVRSILVNEIFKNEIDKIRQGVKEGKSVAFCINESPCFPPVVSSMIAIGEETNTLSMVFRKIETNYNRDLEMTIKLATTLIEPLTIILLGMVVGVIVVAVLLPIFRMNFSAY